MRYFFIICLSVFSLTTQAQEITGTWEQQDEDRYTSYTKLCIVNICGKYIGFTYDMDKDSGNCKADFFGYYNKKQLYLRGETTDFIEYTPSPNHVLAIYSLSYKKENGDEILEGTVYEKPDTIYQAIDGVLKMTIIEDLQPEYLRLKKTSPYADSTAYMKKMAAKPCKSDIQVVASTTIVAPVKEKPIEKPVEQKPFVTTPVIISPQEQLLQLKTKRINDTLSVIDVPEKELLIRVIDNAITDGDTISILHNGNLIAEKIPVSGKPYPVQFSLSKENPYHELTLIAHNLGSIPPNTALLLISSGGKEYKLYAYADLKKNAVIIFRYTGP